MKLKDLKFDDTNVNSHSVRGMELLDKSIENYGWTEAIVTSSDGVVLSGNARKEIGMKQGFDDAIYVESDGSRPVIINRTDLKSNTKKFVEAKILNNTVSKHNYIEDSEVVEMLAAEYDLEPLDNYGLKAPYDMDVDVDEFFAQDHGTGGDGKMKIVLQYSPEEHTRVMDALLKIAKTPEAALWKLLKL